MLLTPNTVFFSEDIITFVTTFSTIGTCCPKSPNCPKMKPAAPKEERNFLGATDLFEKYAIVKRVRATYSYP